jgi:hypothetical protein
MLVYALCVLAPAVTFALGDAARAAPCLTGDHLAQGHAHPYSAARHQHASDPGHDHVSLEGASGISFDLKCCGLMCIPVLPVTFLDLSVSPPAIEHVQFVVAHGAADARWL